MAKLSAPISDQDHQQGMANAPITFVEYGDYQCPFCRLAYPIILQLQKELDNQLNFVFRHFPLKKAHPQAFEAAQAAEAAAQQNKFNEMHRLLYRSPQDLTSELFLSLAQQLGLDLEKFKQDMHNPATIQKIEQDFQSGIRSGVNGTPCFYINSVRYDEDPSYDSLLNALKQANIAN